MKRILLSLLVMLLLLALALATSAGAPAKTAHAQGGVLQCQGTESIAYHPGITNTPATVVGSANDTLAPCVVPTHPALSGGTAAFSVTIPNATCTSLTFPHYSITFHWNDGSQSQVNFSTTVTTKLVTGETQVVSIGTVVSGVEEGALAVRTVTNLNIDLTACFTPAGLQSNGGPTSLDFHL